MTILVLGIDGYIGFPLAMRLAVAGYEVVGIDNLIRRKYVTEVGGDSALPIKSMPDRLKAFNQIFGKKIKFEKGDLKNYKFIFQIIKKHKPDAIVHLAELASAPFSMIDVNHAVLTQSNNLIGTLNVLHAMKELVPSCHLVKQGSIGEYGTPNIDIPEGFFEIEYNGRRDRLPFPRAAFTDWYHWSKVHDSGNITMACQVWNLRSTDIMQGIVYGTRTEEMATDDLLTRFDFDAVFGTFLNRFCAQAVSGHNLTPYGKGGQRRPIIALRDTVKCFLLAIQNPPQAGEYRVFNQFDEVYTVMEVAEKIQKVANQIGYKTQIKCCPNPRVENDEIKYYNPIHEKLYELGFKATHNLDDELKIMLNDLDKYKQRIIAKQDQFKPKIQW